MGAECCLAFREGLKRLEGNVLAHSGIAKFIGHLIEAVWQGCDVARVANALAHTARYIEMEFPLKEVPVEPPTTRVMVLGTEQERNEYFDMLQKAKKL